MLSALQSLMAMCLTTSVVGIRLAASRANVSMPGPMFTRLSRFDADSWKKPRSGSLRMQSSRKTKMPGTSVSVRQMASLQLTRNSNIKATIMGELRNRFAANMKHCSGGTCFGSPSSDSQHPPVGVLRLQDLFGSEYVGELEVGTADGLPQAKMRVIYDTGSTDLWVLSDLCSTGCIRHGHHAFNHSLSETFEEPEEPEALSTMYGSGEIHGRVGFDTVRVGSLVSENQMIGLISEEIGATFAQLTFDGLVGLGFPALTSTEGPNAGALPFVDNLMQQGHLKTPWFAFYLHSDPSNGGAVLWGGVDERLYEGPLKWFPVVEEAYWTLDLVSFQMANATFDFEPNSYDFLQRQQQRSLSGEPTLDKKKPRLVVDSGTTFFSAPGFLYDAITAALPSGSEKCANMRRIPAMIFTIRDVAGVAQEIVIPAEEYMVKSTIWKNMCMAGVFAMDLDPEEQPVFIIGEVFMRHYFTVFSRGQGGEASHVGFARSKEDEAAEAFFEGRSA